MKRTLSTVIFLFAAITLMAQNSFIVADKNGNSQLVQSLIFQQDANNDRFSWNTNNDANGYQQTRDIKDLLFIARAKKELTTASAEEVTKTLEEVSGKDGVSADAFAAALHANPNVEEVYTEDGSNMILKLKDFKTHIVYPLYEDTQLFSNYSLSLEMGRQIADIKVPNRGKAKDDGLGWNGKVAIFNHFQGISGYEAQNDMVNQLECLFENQGYDVEFYGNKANPGYGSPDYEQMFNHANLTNVIHNSKDYKAIFIFSHGFEADNSSLKSDSRTFFATCEKVDVGPDEDWAIFSKEDGTYYHVYPVEGLNAHNDCIVYLGSCFGIPSEGFSTAADAFPQKNNTVIIGWQGANVISQADALLTFYLMLNEEFSLKEALSSSFHNDYKFRDSRKKTINIPDNRTLTSNDNSKKPKYEWGFEADYSWDYFWDHYDDAYLMAVEGHINVKNDDYLPRLVGFSLEPVWPEELSNNEYPIQLAIVDTKRNNRFLFHYSLKDIPEGLYLYRLDLQYRFWGEAKWSRLKCKRGFLFLSGLLKDNAAQIILSKEEIQTPIILDDRGEQLKSIVLPTGGSKEFVVDGYRGHTYKTVSLDPDIATVSVSGSTLTVTGVSEGSTFIGVEDEQNKEIAIAEVIVNQGGETPDASIITFEDPNVKAICVANWDTNGDGELSKDEAAAVTDLGTVFESNQKITSFNELQFFTGLTNIEDSTFFYCRDLTSVTIPNSVTNIGNGAFYYCDGLTSVTIPNSVTNIGKNAFNDCSSLTSIIIPNSVTNIGNGAFKYCRLTSITIPNSLTSIGNDTFGYCSSLTSVTIPNSVMSIGSYAFEYCSSLTSITIPNSVTNIGDGAFSSSGLTSITIPTSVTIIGNCAFAYSSLTSLIIPSSVTSIGQQTFEGCRNLASIIVEKGNTVYDSRDNCNAIIHTATNRLITGSKKTVIPNTVKCIGYRAFMNYDGLTSIAIPNSVEEIESDAFYGCKNLTSVTLPNSLIHFWYGIFYYCPLQEIYSYITMPYKVNIFNNSSYGATLYVPKGTKTKYEETEGWNSFKIILEM